MWPLAEPLRLSACRFCASTISSVCLISLCSLGLDFLLGFLGDFINPNQVDLFVYQFISDIFERGINPREACLRLDVSILSHTGIILLERMEGSCEVVAHQVTMSLDGLPWGLAPLCECGSLPGSITVSWHGEDQEECFLRCHRCRGCSARAIPRPEWVIPGKGRSLLLPYPVTEDLASWLVIPRGPPPNSKIPKNTSRSDRSATRSPRRKHRRQRLRVQLISPLASPKIKIKSRGGRRRQRRGHPLVTGLNDLKI
jgi:hypothetical protein